MSKKRHSERERAVVAERVRNGEPVEKVANEEGVSRQTIQSWIRGSAEITKGRFVEMPSPRSTSVELVFPDGTTLRVFG